MKCEVCDGTGEKVVKEMWVKCYKCKGRGETKPRDNTGSKPRQFIMNERREKMISDGVTKIGVAMAVNNKDGQKFLEIELIVNEIRRELGTI